MSLAAYASKTNKYYYAYVVHVNTSMISSKIIYMLYMYTCVEFVFNLISKLLIMAKKISHSIILFS